jgi:ATP-dependent Lhr-like helicase
VSKRPHRALQAFNPCVRDWFAASFGEPTAPQSSGWPAIARGDSTLIVSPTGSGKTLAAFLWAIDRVMFSPLPAPDRRCRILYVSPLKALAVDVERNLRSPIAGIANAAQTIGASFVQPAVAIRTGDTPASERTRFQKEPADILITTPESLYLLLTSRSREVLRSIQTVIVDEIHALVPTKRGAHLMLSLERLQRICPHPLQRIGLSATQRPLDEVARFLGGASASARAAGDAPKVEAAVAGQGPPLPGVEADLHAEFAGNDVSVDYRPVTIVDARQPKVLRLTVEVPVEDLAKLSKPIDVPSGPAAQGPVAPSIWSSIHPRLLELIRAHRTTLLFANSRRLAERLAGALNELAGETIARAHHGSLAREQRLEIEDALKAGRIPALVATSSLELGIDMGAIDLVIQIEAPPSVAGGMQRIGRASHQVNAVSEGIVFPKFRGDLVACAAVTRAMHEGRIEATRYPRNPLDVLAQQIVAMVAVEPWGVNELFAAVRGAAPFAGLSRPIFEGVLDMLSGRYPSDEFAELRPRLTWDRIGGTLAARQGAGRVAIVNGGTIPDRGLYGVFLSGAQKGAARVGELDEEMVFESRVGETFVLGASTWRIEDITHDRVVVSPAPGEPGKMPFWHGDRPGRPLELGMAIGRLIRELRGMPRAAALVRLTGEHDLDRTAAENLLQYLADQERATQAVPDDRTLVIERYRDELGDWRVCVLAPFGGQVLAPWAMVAEARIRERLDIDVETMWSDDGFVVRFPDADQPPDPSLLLPPPDEAERLLLHQLGGTALFAACFREVAARALLLPRRRPGARTPLWQQRKRAADLLAVSARFGSFPALLETYRECLRDRFDVPALIDLLARVASRSTRVATVDTESPSPFAASLLFAYTANFIYDGDAPLAERRAQALLVDQAQLSDLLGDIELRELLDAAVIDEVEQQLQHLDARYHARSADAVHDLLLRIGDLTAAEIATRCASEAVARSVRSLVAQRRLVTVRVAGQSRFIAVEDAGRYRDAIGAPLPPGLPGALLEGVADPLGDLALRYARTHGPFTAEAMAARLGIAPKAAAATLARLAARGRVLQGAFRPGRTGREWCEADVLRQIRQRSLARLRHEVEPVSAAALGRLSVAWHGLTMPRRGPDALLDVVEQLQGAPIAASLLEREVLPARIEDYRSSDLDLLAAAGEVVWVGVEPLGERDGRIALYLTDHAGRLLPPYQGLASGTDDQATSAAGGDERAQRVLDHLRREGASFFASLHAACGGGYPGDTVTALWDLAWRGLITNDTFGALRAFVQPPPRRRHHDGGRAFRSRRLTPPSAEGRWSLVESRAGGRPTSTLWAAAIAQQLLTRHGVMTREAVAVENLPGGFGAVYEVLKAMEDAGRVRRGYFVGGLGATQFALPAAVDLLRSVRDVPEVAQTVCLAATDPANPYGAILKWPAGPGGGATPAVPAGGQAAAPGSRDRRGPTRSVGASVILVNGSLAAFVGKADRQFLTFLPEDEPSRSTVAREIARVLFTLATAGTDRAGMLIGELDGVDASRHAMAPFLEEAGFVRRPTGFQAAPPRQSDGQRHVPQAV